MERVLPDCSLGKIEMRRMIHPTLFSLAAVFLIAPVVWAQADNQEIIHDAEYYVLEAQHGENGPLKIRS